MKFLVLEMQDGIAETVSRRSVTLTVNNSEAGSLLVVFPSENDLNSSKSS